MELEENDEYLTNCDLMVRFIMTLLILREDDDVNWCLSTSRGEDPPLRMNKSHQNILRRKFNEINELFTIFN